MSFLCWVLLAMQNGKFEFNDFFPELFVLNFLFVCVKFNSFHHPI